MPMVDVMVAWPGAEPAEVESRIVAPIERIAVGRPRRRAHLLDVPAPGWGWSPSASRSTSPTRTSLVKVYERQSALGFTAAAATSLPPDRRAALDRRRAFPEPHALGRGLVERPPAAARGRARPGALGGAGGEPGPAHRRPAAGRARGARPRPHGRGRDQLDAAHGRPPGGLRPAGRGLGRARQPRDPDRGGAALPQRRRRSAAWWSASPGGRPVYVSPGGAGDRRTGRGARRRLLLSRARGRLRGRPRRAASTRQ